MLIDNLNKTRCVLLKDNNDINVMPLLVESIRTVPKEVNIGALCYNQPITFWRNKLSRGINCYNDNPVDLIKVKKPIAIFIDSFNQMLLHLGARQSLTLVRSYLCNNMITKLIIIIHTDCELQFIKLEPQLKHFAQFTMSCNGESDITKLRIYSEQKKGAKIIKEIEDLTCDQKEGLKASKVLIEKVEKDDSEISPHSLTTFKIGLESKEMLARDALQLPYLNKQSPGQVYYKHDAVDDWDDEDPDEDLDI